MGILWAAYKAGSFTDLPADMAQEQFAEAIEALERQFDHVYLIDDFHSAYKAERGPVALACTKSEDLAVSAEGVPFAWASKRNKLRSAAAFLQMHKHMKTTGILFVKGRADAVPMMRHLHKYDLLHYVGKPRAGEFLFSMRGRGSG